MILANTRDYSIKIVIAKAFIKLIFILRLTMKPFFASFLLLLILTSNASAAKIIIINGNIPQEFDTKIPRVQYQENTNFAVSNIVFTEKINDKALLFQRSTDSCKSLVNEVLQKIPSYQYAGLKKVELLYDKSAKRGGANATFMSIRCNDISDSELKAVVVHELGHIVDGSYIQGYSREESAFVDLGTPVKKDDLSVNYYSLSWKNNSTKQANSKNADFCSTYGASDPYEDFAECYIFYALQPSQFEKNAKSSAILNKKYEFMRDIVFNGSKFLSSSQIFAKSQVYDNTRLSHSL